ncbi:hypothetical protein [Paraburkholderia nodosa]|uniref:hypothetical protein n=1 Tax=Paraburkholderia nodosa TaxID=392320 RepID=UPI000481F71B|nr:hypothetical protein [Paraburkholderia nodosa]
MKAANHIKITAALSACGYSVDMSQHARLRAAERTSVAPSRVLELVTTRCAVALPFRSANRSYHLFLDKEKMIFMVAVVAIEGGSESSPASVVTVLTREHFENDAGPIGKKALRIAASRVLDPVDFRRWEQREFGPGGMRRRYRVLTYYKRKDGTTGCKVFNDAPVCEHFVDEYALTNAAGHPGFWDWYARQASRASLPIASVVSMRIADTDKIRLEVSAPARECPCCEAKKSQ